MTAFPEAPFGATDRLDLEPVPLAVIRHEGLRIGDLRDAFDRGYRAIAAQFADGTLTPAGPALAIYHGNPMEVFDLELGFPVANAPAQPIAAGDGPPITAAALPAGPATATTVFGSYEGLGAGWTGLVERSLAEGLQPRGISIEVYVSDPTVAPEQLRTDLILPVS
ncbi:GyrI-like domain-containing protein [Microbacterium sp. KUDC0406]|uniref:GyrI-like domain-containing protein n=1 Tax=Microbacterium sp. KUDC0406 TaxID=2909588 RepID=UPI001F161DEB|nr:GyrI-like domain-containing protein [Microbacterium sp. KUDC0406]UJP10811.1 GyrI-like domain-containing protein [Microbacterium sp. KUDC0406]